MTIRDQIVKLKRQLYPTGRAWNMPNDSYMHGLHRALANSEAQAYIDSLAIKNAQLPDNDMFTLADATDWERRLGLITNLLTPFADRKAAIRRKLQAPGTQPAKGHYLYLQRMLQAAGFTVYVHENIIELYPSGYGGTYNPASLNSLILSKTKYGVSKYGGRKYGKYLNQIVANNIYNSSDVNFNIGNSLRSTFFIGGQTLGAYANVLSSREAEFRQLILSIKQTQNIGILFINYI